MNALYVILSLLFGLNLFGMHPGKRAAIHAQNANSQIVTDNGTTTIINANPGTVVVLDDTHFNPPR